MKTKKIILLPFIFSLTFIIGCVSEYPYYDIPVDDQGKAIITPVSQTTSPGVTLLDGEFTINSYLPNAKSGDVMTVDLLTHQEPSWGGENQLLPIEGSSKQATVASDLNISVSFTREAGWLRKFGDVVTVTISGPTDSGIIRVTVGRAISATLVGSGEEAYFDVEISPKYSEYTGSLVVQKMTSEGWENFGTFSPPYAVPIAVSDFGESDAISLKFSATLGQNTEELVVDVDINDVE